MASLCFSSRNIASAVVWMSPFHIIFLASSHPVGPWPSLPSVFYSIHSLLLTKETRYCDINTEECHFLVFVVEYLNEFELIHIAHRRDAQWGVKCILVRKIYKGRFTHSMPCPCRAAKGLESSFPFDLHSAAVSVSHLPCHGHAHAMFWPCRSSQSHGTTQPSRDGLWATCPRSAFSGYHAEFHEDCYQKHTNSPHNDPYLWL